MKGIHNRQKMVVRPRETAQKYIVRKETVQRGRTSVRRGIGGKGYPAKGK